MFGSNKNDIRFSLIEKRLEKLENKVVELQGVIDKYKNDINKKEIENKLNSMKNNAVVIKKGRKPKA